MKNFTYILFFTSMLCVGCTKQLPEVYIDGEVGNGSNGVGSAGIKEDSLAIVQLYKELGGDKWYRRENWNSDKPLDMWEGISVENIDGRKRIVSLNLSRNNLQGTLSPIIGKLLEIKRIDLSYNEGLTGNLPQEIYGLANLTTLRLSYCCFTGPIPAEINNLSQLDTLDLRNTSTVKMGENWVTKMLTFSGPLPSEIGDLQKLRYLSLGHNLFSGEIPASIGKLTMLEYLDIECCMFSGEIPKTIASLKNLRFLYGGQNLFSGSIPDDLMSLQKLNELAFEQNKLEGEIPATIGTLKELRYLDLSKNKISGQLPQSLINLEALEGIYLHNNQIQGRIPDGFGEDKQPHLMRCDLSNNKLVGYLPKIVNRGWSKDMKSYPGHQYTEFVLKGNRLAGNIPSEYLQNSYLLSLIAPQQIGYSFHNYDLKDNFPSSK